MADETVAVVFDDLDEKDRVEFKLTVLPGQGEIVRARFQDGRTPTKRTVYFYDTKHLEAFNERVVLRARITDGDDDDATVKLRPADHTDRDARWRTIDKVAVEVDVVGEKRTPSAKLDRTLDRGRVQDVAEDRRKVGALMSKAQEQLFKTYAPHGLELEELKVLGPIHAQKWEREDLEGFPYKFCVETWSVPGAMEFTELSIKVLAPEASAAETAFRAFVAGLGLDVTGQQVAKTERVLKHFADRLQD